jgi:ribonuclease P protein component
MGKPLEHLKKRSQFLRVAEERKKIVFDGFVIQGFYRADHSDTTRIGFTVTRRVGDAVTRNRTKRRLRAAARIAFNQFTMTGSDYVIIGRKSTASASFQKLQSDLKQAVTKFVSQQSKNR